MEKFKINNIKDNKSELKTFRIKTELLTRIEELSNKYNISIKICNTDTYIHKQANLFVVKIVKK